MYKQVISLFLRILSDSPSVELPYSSSTRDCIQILDIYCSKIQVPQIAAQYTSMNTAFQLGPCLG